MAYSNKVLDHYNHPRNVGSLDKSDPNVGTGMVGAPECGDVLKLQVKTRTEPGEPVVVTAPEQHPRPLAEDQGGEEESRRY